MDGASLACVPDKIEIIIARERCKVVSRGWMDSHANQGVLQPAPLRSLGVLGTGLSVSPGKMMAHHHDRVHLSSGPLGGYCVRYTDLFSRPC